MSYKIRLCLAVSLIAALISPGWSQVVHSVKYEVNTIGDAAALEVHLYIKMTKLERIDDTFKEVDGFEPNFEVRNAENEVKIGSGRITNRGGVFGENFLVFEVSDVTETLINDFMEGNTPYYIFIRKSLPIKLVDSTFTETRVLNLTPTELKQATLRKLRLTKRQADLLLRASGGASFLFNNKFDLGQEVATRDSGATVYHLSFNYHAPLPLWRRLNWAITGRLSTDKRDPLNRIALFPLNFNRFAFNETLPYEYGAQIGIESNQDFTFQRINFTGYFQSLIPNFIDLSYGENRLRLRPVVKFGLKGLLEYEERAGREKNKDIQIFSEIYYFIPILDIYSLLVEGTVFSNPTADDSEIHYQFDFTLGANVPGTGFKVMAKYQTGQNDINRIEDSQLLLGLLIDIFERKHN